MYATAHRVFREDEKEGIKHGINAFLHLHGPEFAWPEDPWKLPETHPGRVLGQKVELEPGGNKVRSYLDILAPDGTPWEEVRAAVDQLSIEFIVTEGVDGLDGLNPPPNPCVFRRDSVVLRFGAHEEMNRLEELHVLFDKLVDPATASWTWTP